MPHLRRLALIPALAVLAGAAYAADEQPQVPVLAKKEVTLKGRNDADVASRELWYSRFDGKEWGAFQKHGMPFPRDTPIVWAPPEGHWRTYVRVIEVSTAAMPEPAQQTNAKLFTEFIIDRSAPQVTVQAPATAAKLAGGTKVAVRWAVVDANLAANPIAIQWSRNGDGKFEAVASGLPNNGAYEWTLPKDMTVAGQLRITAVDKAGNVGGADATQLLVDSIAPAGRVTGPAITATAESQLALQIADAGPAGLAGARVMVSQDDGQTWAEGPVVEAPFKAVAWRAPADGRFRFAVVARDNAGNVSATPRGKSDDQFTVLVDSTRPVVLLTGATGIVDANGMTVRPQYLPGTRVAVQFDAKDVALAENPITIWLSVDNGATWDAVGRNQPADAAFRFEIPNKVTRQARIKVSAIDLAGNVGEVVAGEPFIIASPEVKVDPGNVGLE